jgi:hypothetical protein
VRTLTVRHRRAPTSSESASPPSPNTHPRNRKDRRPLGRRHHHGHQAPNRSRGFGRASGGAREAAQDRGGVERRAPLTHEVARLRGANASRSRARALEHRRDRTAAEERLRDIDGQLRQENARPDFGEARKVISWLSETWGSLTVAERVEALRLLVSRVSYVPSASLYPTIVRIEQYGRALVESRVIEELPLRAQAERAGALVSPSHTG